METILEVKDITKSFPGVLAVDNISFDLKKGEILSLVGENGAGKSTLTNMISGVLQPDKGEILLENQKMSFESSHEAIQAGVGMVFQELSMVGNLSVAENIFANRQLVGRFNNIRWKKMFKEADVLLQRFGLDVDPRTLVKDLSLGKQQILEILKAISTNPKVLILDEPTTSLTDVEVNALFDNINELQKQGMAFIYISHKLSEIFQIADRVMVMRDGQYVDTKPIIDVTEQSLVYMMVGRELKDVYGTPKPDEIGEEYFQVKGLNQKDMFKNISFGLKKGEILGIAGLVGAGRTDLAQAIFGIAPKESGTLVLDGKQINVNSSTDATKNGIAYLTENRKELGLFLGMTIRDNLIAPSLEKFASSGMMQKKAIEANAKKQVEAYNIATPSIAQKILNLSGGNQQKCLIAMWMGINPRVVIFDEPTRGVDVGARSEIYQKLRELASIGIGVIMISSDLPELLGMSDRILVMFDGQLNVEIMPKDFSEELILTYAAGVEDTEATYQSLGKDERGYLLGKAEATLEKVIKDTAQTVHIAVLEGSEVVFIEKIEAIKKVEMMTRVGRRSPSHCTGVGKVLLSGAPDALVDRVSKKLMRHTPNTIFDRTLFKQEIEQIAANGIGFDNEEHESGIRCISAPIKNKENKVIAAISISTQKNEVDDERFASLKNNVLESAQAISKLMGA